MRLTINVELDTSSLKDVAWLAAYSQANVMVADSIKDLLKEQEEKEEIPTPEADSTPEPEPEPEQAPEPEPVAEEKPKRKRNKKEPEPTPEPEPEPEPSQETSTEPGELPFDEEVAAPAVEPTPKPVGPATATEQDWRNALSAKKAELGIDAGTDKYREFLDWIHKSSELFGHRAPSHLEPEKLAKFLEQFNLLTWTESEGFHIYKAPF